MKETFMTAGILTAIILCVVGIVKLPFDGFKTKHPKTYKATFTGISIVLVVVTCTVDQLFIMKDVLLSTNFAVLLAATCSGVFGLYSSYEGLGLKLLVQKLLISLKALKTASPENKVLKKLNQIDMDKLIVLLQETKNKNEQSSDNEQKSTNE